jgi:hypothetical protein
MHMAWSVLLLCCSIDLREFCNVTCRRRVFNCFALIPVEFCTYGPVQLYVDVTLILDVVLISSTDLRAFQGSQAITDLKITEQLAGLGVTQGKFIYQLLKVPANADKLRSPHPSRTGLVGNIVHKQEMCRQPFYKMSNGPESTC